MQDEVDVDRLVHQLLGVVHRGAGVQGQRQPATGHEHPRQRRDGGRELGASEVHQRVPRRDRSPAGRRGRPQEAVEVAHGEGEVREPAARLVDHRRRQVDAGGLRPGGGEVRRDVAGSGADVHHGEPAREDRHPVQQPAVEGLAVQLVAQPLGVRRRHRVVRRPHLRVASARSLGQHDLAVHGGRSGGRRRLGLDRPEEVHPPPVLLARPSFQLVHQRGGPFMSGRQPSQHRLHRIAVGERVQPVGTGAQLPRRLRAAQQQHGDQRPLVGLEGEPLVEQLVVLQRARAAVGPHDPDQATLLEAAQRLGQQRLVVVDDRVPAAGLVARGLQGVERHRVARRHRPLLLQQAPEDALVDGVEDEVVGHAPTLRTAPGQRHTKWSPRRPLRMTSRAQPADWTR